MRSIIKSIIALTILLTVGCSPQKRAEKLQDKLAVESIENINGSLSGGWVVTLRVRNQTNYMPTLRTGEGDIYCDNVHIAHAALVSSVPIPKKSPSSVDIPLEIKILNPLRAIALLLKIKEQNFDGIDLSYSADIEVIGIKKRIASERVAAKTIFEKLGYTTK